MSPSCHYDMTQEGSLLPDQLTNESLINMNNRIESPMSHSCHYDMTQEGSLLPHQLTNESLTVLLKSKHMKLLSSINCEPMTQLDTSSNAHTLLDTSSNAHTQPTDTK